MDFVTGFQGPMYWEDDQEPPMYFEARDLSVREAMALFVKRRALVTSFHVGLCGWADAVYDALEAVPEEISDGYVPWDTGVTVGPFSIPDLNNNRVGARGKFEIRISSNGAPSAREVYLRRAAETPDVKEVQDLVARLSASPCSVYLTVQ